MSTVSNWIHAEGVRLRTDFTNFETWTLAEKTKMKLWIDKVILHHQPMGTMPPIAKEPPPK